MGVFNSIRVPHVRDRDSGAFLRFFQLRRGITCQLESHTKLPRFADGMIYRAMYISSKLQSKLPADLAQASHRTLAALGKLWIASESTLTLTEKQT